MNPSGQLTSTVGIALGTVLLVLGVGAYVVTDFASATALIPRSLASSSWFSAS